MKIRVACPKCGNTFAEFTEEDLKSRTKKRRYKSLMTRPSLCAGCNTWVLRGKKEKA